MGKRSSNIILLGMILGAVLGALGGYYLGDLFLHIKFLGTIFLNALKMIVIPLVIASMIVGVTSLGDIRKLGRTAGKTLAFYLATTGFSVLVGIILVNIIRPGLGVPLIGEGVPEFVTEGGERTIIDIIVGLVPDNIFGAAASGQILPLIVFSLIFGGVLTAIGSNGRPVIAFFEGVNMAIMKIVMLIIYFAPIGIFALIGGIVAQNQASVERIVSALGLYAVTVILGLLIHATITLPMILKIMGRKNPLQYVVNMGQALATAFTTASSSATLPVTMECVEEKNKVDSKAASFVLPLGATINMDGTALYEAVAAIFIAQIYGIDLSIGAQVIIFFTATLASIGAAAIPEAGLVMMTLVLSAVGLPLEGIGIILAIDWFLDRCRTTVNVWGDSVGAAVIGETSEIKVYLTRTAPDKKAAVSRTKPSPAREHAVPNKNKSGSQDRMYRGQHDRRQSRRTGGGRQRPDRSGKHERNGRFQKVTHQEARPKPVGGAKKPEKIPHFVVEKEIEKVKKQLDDLSEKNKPVNHQKKPDKQKDSEFFKNVEFSKMNLLEGRRTNQGSTSITTDEKKEKEKFSALSITPPDVFKPDVTYDKSVKPTVDEADSSNKIDETALSTSSEHEENSAPVKKKDSSHKEDEDIDELESGSIVSWGRGRKKKFIK